MSEGMSTSDGWKFAPRTVEREARPAPAVVELRTVSGLIERDVRRKALSAERVALTRRIADLQVNQPVPSDPAERASETNLEQWNGAPESHNVGALASSEPGSLTEPPPSEPAAPALTFSALPPPPAFAPPPPPPGRASESMAASAGTSPEAPTAPVLGERLTARTWAEEIDRAYDPLADRVHNLSDEELNAALHAILAETEALTVRDPSFAATGDAIHSWVVWAVDKWDELRRLPTAQERQDQVRQWWRSIDRYVVNAFNVSTTSSALDRLLIARLMGAWGALASGAYGFQVEWIGIRAGQPFVAGVVERDLATEPVPVPPEHPDWSGKTAGWPTAGNSGLRIDGKVLIQATQPYYA
jgi:hypothetical protein